ncbi:DNA-3-methyladenine glycosylase I [PVC group bacterium]|nr:DNA-3-methyladenine glycosylase I [PVC group bacterium]
MYAKKIVKKRCAWTGLNPVLIKYHDAEWGCPVKSEKLLFEFLILEGAQAGLSWLTILKKRDEYRKVFKNFDPVKVGLFTKKDVEKHLKNPGIVRNRLKVESTVSNAKAYLAVQKEFGSFCNYIWKFIEGKPIQNSFKTLSQIPAKTPLSDEISDDLKKRGFRFVGSTICYAFMQAIGMVNDHTVDCYRYKEIKNRPKK